MKFLFLKIIVAIFSVGVAKGLWFSFLALLIKTGPLFAKAAVFISQFNYFGWLLFGYLCIFFYTAILKSFAKMGVPTEVRW